MTPRLLAYELLGKAEKSKQFSNIALDHALESSGMSDPDKRLASILFYGVIERRITLDYRIKQLSSRPIDSIDPNVLCAIRLGLYQLMYLDRIPPHAAINEAVGLCSRKSAGFVNAILRSHTRTPISLPDKTDFAEYLSVSYSLCPEIVQRLISSYGEQDTEAILRGFDRTARTTLRVNTLKTDRESLASAIKDAEPTKNSPVGLYANGAIRQLSGFDEGLFFVQDLACAISAEALGASKGDKIIDVCACPGGKSFAAAILSEGEVTSFDIHDSKLSLIEDGAKRLGLDGVKAAECDATSPREDLFGHFDKVICDVPCSGLGVLGKKPDIRHRDNQSLQNLPELQYDILSKSSQYLKDGGVILYSTCTLNPEENERVVERFLTEHKGFRTEDFTVGHLESQDGILTLLPHIHNTDGFFIAKLRKE